MSESVEMYLVMIALLREDNQPVPLSLLASKLAISSVSANEMCRKLEERGLVSYQPYKGVTLTDTGEAEAQLVLSRRRLWVIFLVQNLGIEPVEADEIACQLEHITSDKLVESLKDFLEHAPSTLHSHAPLRTPPYGQSDKAYPLAACTAGFHGRIAAISANAAIMDFLQAQGIQPDVEFEVLAVGAGGSILLSTGTQHLSLARSVAMQIEVAPIVDVPGRRSSAWEKCSTFWSCLQGNRACACDVLTFTHDVADRQHLLEATQYAGRIE